MMGEATWEKEREMDGGVGKDRCVTQSSRACWMRVIGG